MSFILCLSLNHVAGSTLSLLCRRKSVGYTLVSAVLLCVRRLIRADVFRFLLCSESEPHTRRPLPVSTCTFG